MHKIICSYRTILPAGVPRVTPLEEAARPMTDAEMLNLGMVRVSGDIFSCNQQEIRDDDTLEWQSVVALPGTVVSEGLLQERHDKLPSEIRKQVLKASVIRSETGNARAKATKSLSDAAKEARRVVGDVGGEPLLDPASPELLLTEAKRLADSPDSDLKRETVRMADVAESDVVEADSIVPHQWAGEPKQ